MKGKTFSAIALIIVIISFFLPFFSASAMGFELNLTGLDMSFGYDMGGYGRAGGDMHFLIVLALPLVALVLNLAIRNTKVTGIFTIIAAAVDIYIILAIKSYIVNYLGFASELMSSEIGYYGILIFSIIAAIAAIAGMFDKTAVAVRGATVPATGSADAAVFKAPSAAPKVIPSEKNSALSAATKSREMIAFVANAVHRSKELRQQSFNTKERLFARVW